jgi:ubiquinone/menaquinone biosynthesis C-methylase UbiE
MATNLQDTARYIPALGFRWLTPAYDAVLRWGMREEAFKRRLIERLGLQAGQQVLDLGCGTGTLTVMLKASQPAADITGLDGDAQVLSIARLKAERAGTEIRWKEAMAYQLPYPDETFDVVVSSLVTHHLATGDKARAFAEVRRVLRPGGAFHILDFGPPYSFLTTLQARLMIGLEHADDNFHGRLPGLLKAAGFEIMPEAEHRNTIFGPIWFLRAVKTST